MYEYRYDEKNNLLQETRYDNKNSNSVIKGQYNTENKLVRIEIKNGNDPQVYMISYENW